jgi:predicted RNA binding protein YcfA (HicA-like mRNA interferase family)
MPKKIRELKTMLSKAGFICLTKRGKGSHSIWRHPFYEDDVRLSGKDGKDAKPYQEKSVNKAIQEIKRKENE